MIYMRYNQTLNMLQIMTNALHVLLQSWGAVQHTARLYNLAQDNIRLVNPANLEIVRRAAQVLSRYNRPIPSEWKVQAGIYFSQFTPRLKYGVKVPSVEAAEILGRGSTTGHHFPCGGEGSDFRIKNTSVAGADTYGIG